MRAVVYTLGCKVNDVESGSIIRGLETLGYEVSRELVNADLYITTVSCAVLCKISAAALSIKRDRLLPRK